MTSSLQPKIRSAPSPLDAATEGLQIANVDAALWAARRGDAMLAVLRAKFCPGSELARRLCDTQPALLVLAAPENRVWGAACLASQVVAGRPWPGANGLGHCLMIVRYELAAMTAMDSPRPSKRQSDHAGVQAAFDSHAAPGEQDSAPFKQAKLEQQLEEVSQAGYMDPPFRYVDVFAGASAFSERAPAFGGVAVGFIEHDPSDHPLRHQLAPDAWI